MKSRAAGFLLHPTSLPGRFGIGDLGPQAEVFLDWAAEAGQSIWQVLPLNATGFGNSPYGTLSAFAGNPLLISPELLEAEGFLPPGAVSRPPELPQQRVDFEQAAPWKHGVLRAAWEFFKSEAPYPLRAELEAFGHAPEQAVWLDDWSLFMALKGRFGGRAWIEWDEAYRLRRYEAISGARRELADEIGYHRFLQFLFFRQWGRLKGEANRRGIRVLGDIPIYVAYDSADVWANPALFQLDDSCRPTAVAGVPPDYFSKTGQLWGNPLYSWDKLEDTGYAWWVERIRANLRLTDLLRIDHFRGFAGYWAVPAGEETAVNGKWMPGPGMRLFSAVERALGKADIVAEDLGEITPDVRELLADSGFPGMRILQFAFGGPDQDYQPHNHVPNCVVYTGTHDNDTTCGWWAQLDPESCERVRTYLGGGGAGIEWDLIRAAYTSVARLAIVPAQDVFGLGSEARMNTPGVGADNWAWRASSQEFTRERAARLRELAVLSGRFRPRPKGPDGGR